ncbi:MAG: TPM domain-containing protein [Turicibacter sp.]|nr:TPM domain-containing protein [Turicibacter sp.]
MKKIGLILLGWVLASTMAVAQAANRVIDDANLFNASQIDSLQSRMDGLGPELFIVTTDDARGLSPAAYANNAFDDLNVGDDGSLFLIDMDNREIFVLTAGILSRIDVDPILDRAFDFMPSGNYYGAANAFLDGISLPAAGYVLASKRLVDEAGALGESEVSQLSAQISELEQSIGGSVYVLATNNSMGMGHNDFLNGLADALQNQANPNAILMLIDFANGEVSIQNWGRTTSFLNNSRIDSLLGNAIHYLNNDDVSGAIASTLAELGSLSDQPLSNEAASPSRVPTWMFWIAAVWFYFLMMGRWAAGKTIPGFLIKKRRSRPVMAAPTPTFGGGASGGLGGGWGNPVPRRRGMGPFGWFMMGRMTAPRPRRRSMWGGGGWGAPPRPRAPRPPAPPRSAPRPAPKPPTRSTGSGLFGSGGGTQPRNSGSKTFGSSQSRSSGSKTFGSSSSRSSGSKTFGSSTSRSSGSKPFGGGGGGFGSRPSGLPRGGGGGGGSRGGGGRKF